MSTKDGSRGVSRKQKCNQYPNPIARQIPVGVLKVYKTRRNVHWISVNLDALF